MEHGGGERGGCARRERIGEMRGRSGPSAGDHRHRHGARDGRGQLQLEPGARSVAVDAGEEDLARAAIDRLARPRHRVAAGRARTAVRVHFEAAVRPPLRVDGDEGALGPRQAGDTREERGIGERRAVQRNLVGSGAQERLGVRNGAHPTSDRERDRELPCDALDEGDEGPALLQRGADVEEAHLVRSGPAIGARLVDRIARVAQLHEPDALHHPAFLHVEAGDDPPRQHDSACWPSARPNRPSYRAVPAMAPASPPIPAAARARRCESSPAPPLAMTLACGAASETSRKSARSNPSSVPSRATAVTTSHSTPSPASVAARRAGEGPWASVQPRTAAFPSLTSIPQATRAVPNRATASPASTGRSTAAVPKMTRSTPAPSVSSAERRSRVPPATWMGIGNAACAVRSMSVVCRLSPKAASRSTTCSYRAPSATKARACAGGSSL